MRIAFVTTITYGDFARDYRAGLMREAEVLACDVDEFEGRPETLLSGEFDHNAVVFSTGSFVRNERVIQELRKNGVDVPIVVSGYPSYHSDVTSVSLDDLSTGHLLAGQMLRDFQGEKSVLVAVILPRYVDSSIPIFTRHLGWFRTLEANGSKLFKVKPMRVSTANSRDMAPATAAAVRKALRVPSRSRPRAILTFCEDMGRAAAAEVKKSAAHHKPLVYSVDLAGSLLEAIDRDGEERVWAAVAGGDPRSYGAYVGRVAILAARGEQPAVVSPLPVQLVTSSTIREQRIHNRKTLLRAYPNLNYLRLLPEVGDLANHGFVEYADLRVDLRKKQVFVLGPKKRIVQLTNRAFYALACLLAAQGNIVSRPILGLSIDRKDPGIVTDPGVTPPQSAGNVQYAVDKARAELKEAGWRHGITAVKGEGFRIERQSASATG